MSSYRDESEALRARCEALEQELEAKQREIDELRAEAPPAERLEKLARELSDAQTEIDRLRVASVPRPQRSLTLLLVLGAPLVVIAVFGAAMLALWNSVDPKTSSPEEMPARRPASVRPDLVVGADRPILSSAPAPRPAMQPSSKPLDRER